MNLRSVKFYLMLALFLGCLLASAAFSQVQGKKSEVLPTSPPTTHARMLKGKAHLVRAGESTESSNGTAADVSLSLYLSDDNKVIVKYMVSIGEIKYAFKAEGATGTGTREGTVATSVGRIPTTNGTFERGEGGDYHIKGRFVSPTEARGTLH